jgi:hypothetical protein
MMRAPPGARSRRTGPCRKPARRGRARRQDRAVPDDRRQDRPGSRFPGSSRRRAPRRRSPRLSGPAQRRGTVRRDSAQRHGLGRVAQHVARLQRHAGGKEIGPRGRRRPPGGPPLAGRRAAETTPVSPWPARSPAPPRRQAAGRPRPCGASRLRARGPRPGRRAPAEPGSGGTWRPLRAIALCCPCPAPHAMVPRRRDPI